MPITPQMPNSLGPSFWGEIVNVRIPVTGSSDTNGVFASLLNPFGKAVVIINTVLYVVTQSSGACTVDIGTAVDAATSNDALIDGLTVATAGSFGAAVDGGTNGKGVKTWAATGYVNVADASGDPTGLVGYLILSCIVPS